MTEMIISRPAPLAPSPRERRELTDRELLVLSRVASGWTNKQIAGELEVNPVTVTNILRRIYEQLNVNNRLGAVVRAFELRIFEVPESGIPSESSMLAADPAP